MEYYGTKCTTGLSLTQNECISAGWHLKHYTSKTYTWAYTISSATRNYGCYEKRGKIYYNPLSSGKNRDSAAKSICKDGSNGKSNLNSHLVGMVPKAFNKLPFIYVY